MQPKDQSFQILYIGSISYSFIRSLNVESLLIGMGPHRSRAFQCNHWRRSWTYFQDSDYMTVWKTVFHRSISIDSTRGMNLLFCPTERLWLILLQVCRSSLHVTAGRGLERAAVMGFFLWCGRINWSTNLHSWRQKECFILRIDGFLDFRL